MRILFVVERFPSSSHTFILQQMKFLVEAGHEVRILADKVGKPPFDRIVTDHGLVGHRRCFEVASGWRRPFQVPWRWLRLLRRRPGWAFGCLNIFRYGKLVTGGRLISAALLLAEKPEPCDVVYGHFGPCAKLGVALRDIGALQGHVVGIFHGKDVGTKSARKLARSYGLVFAKADVVQAVSSHFLGRLIAAGSPAGRTALHRMGADIERFRFAPDTPDDVAGPIILSVGRLMEKKGFDVALRALATLRDRPWRYVIAGDGELRKAWMSLASHLGIAERITFLGWQTQEQILELMRTSRLLLAPSRTARSGDVEGIPVVIMEAVASGIPVISTHHSGIPELISHESTGLLVPEGDPAGLAAAIDRLLGDRPLRERLARQARAFVEHEFNVHAWNRRLLDAFTRLVRESANPNLYEVSESGRDRKKVG